MWLAEEDLEPDDGNHVPMEQPTTIVTPPLSVKDRDDRIRAVFGLTHDDLIPQVNPETLRTYFRYLRDNLTVPFPATYWDFGRLHDQKITVMIHALLDPEGSAYDEEDGLVCRGARPERKDRDPACRDRTQEERGELPADLRLRLLVPQLAVNSAQTQRGQGSSLFRSVAGEGKEG